tara:strand:+ start:104 stop:421 length:318 start_codon:yes stop_codon:yes gene_type:complete
MKKVFVGILLFIVISCDTSTDTKILGTWENKYNKKSFMSFHKNGVGFVGSNNSHNKISWYLMDNVIFIEQEGPPSLSYNFEYKFLDLNTIRIESTGFLDTLYKKN